MSNYLTCPYCNHSQIEGGYIDDEMNIETCDNCEKIFGYEVEITIDFMERKLPCHNGEKHRWETTQAEPPYKFCDYCHKFEWIYKNG